MGIILGIIAVLLFLLMIVFHEFGHFITAKMSGVQVNEFAIGMGPTLFKFQKGETVYSFRLFPIGGYCAMEGENEESDNKRAFVNKPVSKRILIVAAGAIMNIILAVIFMMITLVQQECFASTKISDFSDDAVTSQYGLQVGDVIKSIDGYKIKTYTDIAFSLALNTDFKANVVVERNGSMVELKNVYFKTLESSDGKKTLVRDFYVAPVEKNLSSFVSQTVNEIGSHVKIAYMSILKLVTGEFGLNAVSGPVGIASVITSAAASGLKINFLQGLNNIITIMMVLSVSLGVMNLLPLPALDGGRLIFLIIEAITKKRVNQKYEDMVHKFGFILLMVLFVVIFFNDIYKLFTGSSLSS